jgi:hypothetical protein
MTITLNNHEIHLPAYCVSDEGALVVCGSTTDYEKLPFGGSVKICAHCGEWLN